MEDIQVIEEENGARPLSLQPKTLLYRPVHVVLMWFMRSVSLGFLICSAIGFLQGLAYGPHGWGELVAPGVCLLIGWALARLSGTMQDNDRIAITNTGIEFDPRWKHSLLERTSRDWTDVHSLDFSGR